MRDKVERILKQELRFLALKTRNRLELTQKQMSELLFMNEKSYSDIETGVYMCGTLTCIVLIMMQEDPNAFCKALGNKSINYMMRKCKLYDTDNIWSFYGNI